MTLSSKLRLILGFCGLISCGHAAELLIAAASDLSPLESVLSAGLKAAGIDAVRFSFGSSVNLGRQISQGAPFDVFLSADQDQIRSGLKEGWLTPNSERDYATGRLALWSRTATLHELQQLKDRSIRHISIANPKFAPYGRAARQALENVGLWSEVEDRIVYGENIRQALIFVETGAAEAGILSWSLVADRKGAVLLPENLHAPIRQMGAVVKSSSRQDEARRALEFLAGPEGQKILRSHGLFPPK